MRVLIACEYSGVVREAFRALGHDAYSCDLLPADDSSAFHIRGNALEFLSEGWDMLIAHPPCTDLAVSGARWFPEKRENGSQQRSIDLFMAFINAPIPKIAVENPICIMSTIYRKPNQIIQPWQYGHGETKATCLWLKGLPCLIPTDIVSGRESRIHKMPPSPDRWKQRSKTYPGIAQAMANQWGQNTQSLTLSL